MKLSDTSHAATGGRTRVVLDMETSDPDDFLTLLLLAGHPRVDLRAVTVTPGSAAQVGVVRWGLAKLGKDIPVGAFNLDHPKECVSAWHYNTFGELPASREARPGFEVLSEVLGPDTLLVTGAALKNVGRLLSETAGPPGLGPDCGAGWFCGGGGGG